MICTVESKGQLLEISFTVSGSTAYPDSPNIEIEDAICLSTGCEVTLTPEEESEILPKLLEFWEQNYDPTP